MGWSGDKLAMMVPSDRTSGGDPGASKQRLRRGNRRQSIDDTKGYSFAAVTVMRQILAKFVDEYEIDDKGFKLELEALGAQIFQAGNCGELSARTFQALTQKVPQYTVLFCSLVRFSLVSPADSDDVFLDPNARDHAFTILYPGPAADILKEKDVFNAGQKTTIQVLKDDSIDREDIYVVDAWISEEPLPLRECLKKYNESEFGRTDELIPGEISVSFPDNSKEDGAAVRMTEAQKKELKEEFQRRCTTAAAALRADTQACEDAYKQSKKVNGIYKFVPWKRDGSDNSDSATIKFTLGSYGSYMRNNTKNIQYCYTDYWKHYVIGFVYRRNGLAQESLAYPYEEREQIVFPYYDVRCFIQEKYKIAGDRPGSGNTENIGSFPTKDFIALKEGRAHSVNWAQIYLTYTGNIIPSTAVQTNRTSHSMNSLRGCLSKDNSYNCCIPMIMSGYLKKLLNLGQGTIDEHWERCRYPSATLPAISLLLLFQSLGGDWFLLRQHGKSGRVHTKQNLTSIDISAHFFDTHSLSTWIDRHSQE